MARSMSDDTAVEYIFCLDIGSKCTGYSFGTDKELLKYGKYVAKQSGGEGKRLLRFSKWLSSLINGLPKVPHRVIIESPYYNRNVRTYGVLNKYVAIAQREISRVLDVECEFVSSSKVKSVIGVKKGKTYQDRKKNMVNKINQVYGLDLKYHKSNKNISDDDICDAIAILYTINKLDKVEEDDT
jgi:Holliday junction resolvasome RuvABC endonuclease subunit